MARSRQALLVFVVAIAATAGVTGAARAADPPAPRPWENVDPAVLSEVAQYVYGMPERLANEFPAAYGGVRVEGRLNDTMVIKIVEGASGAAELKAAVDQVRQYSLERTGVALTYSYEPEPISHARRIEVHTGLAQDLETQGPLAAAGLIAFRQGRDSFTLETLREDRRAVASQVRSRYPGVQFRVDAIPATTRPSRHFCASPVSAAQAGSSGSTRSGSAKLRAHLELENRCLSAGSAIDATVVVENDTGKPVEYRMCGTGSPYQAHLKGEQYEQDPGLWKMCMGTVQQLPVGESRWPVRLHTSYSQCSQPESVPLPPRTLPLACVGGVPQTLPAAPYEAVVDAADSELPRPPPVEVRVR